MQANPVISNKSFGGADRFRDEFLIYGVENLEPVQSDDTHPFFTSIDLDTFMCHGVSCFPAGYSSSLFRNFRGFGCSDWG